MCMTLYSVECEQSRWDSNGNLWLVIFPPMEMQTREVRTGTIAFSWGVFLPISSFVYWILNCNQQIRSGKATSFDFEIFFNICKFVSPSSTPRTCNIVLINGQVIPRRLHRQMSLYAYWSSFKVDSHNEFKSLYSE